ncbi:MAG: hypothetical protein ACFB0G_08040 [Leptolyngbyaceae cyanobacterium]
MASPTASSANAVSEKPAASTAAGAEAREMETVNVSEVTPDRVDDLFKELKTLLSTVEKLQKAREDVGDIKPLLLRLLDGELLSGDKLEQLKSGVSGLSKLVKLYSDYQQVLERAQPARALLDDVLKS